MITANLFWFDYTYHFLPLLTAIRLPPHVFRSYLRGDYSDERITVIISMLIAHRHTLSALTFGMITQMEGLL
ncbi:hypothetical protein [Pedobacter sp. MR22-3]|uniref:hypothetical protein n=1 Tax=Pedobacter sp. MR22-3 TaxID=2994552 RepID=UPI002245008D|nr:hypothetical protein [Pedobacter sp. MR22-3]MCX2584230.1 hypothetical protein [Pedobacter sp. MR22-3]